MEEKSEMFDAYYYATGCGRVCQRDDGWLNFFDQIANRISIDIQPSSVLDAGCAWGFLVEKLRARNLNAEGIDISEYAISQVHPDIQAYCRIGSIVEPFSHSYGLIVTIEVLEHMNKDNSAKAIANLCAHTDDILFSSTPFDYKEPTHFNVQPIDAWVEQFARHGFYRDVDYDASYITPWAIRFRRRTEPTARIIREYERHYWEVWKENCDLRTLSVEMRDQLSKLNQQLLDKNQSLLDELNQQLLDKSQSLDESNQQLLDKEQHINNLNIHIQSRDKIIREAQIYLESLRQENTLVKAENEAIKESTTWKTLQKISVIREKLGLRKK